MEAVKHGQFMQQCTAIFVDVDGLRITESQKYMDPEAVPSKVTVPTLFSCNLQSLMFFHVQSLEPVV